MRRALLSLAGLVAGTTLLVSLKSAPGASRLPAQIAADNAAIAAAASASPTPGSVAGLPPAPPVTIPTPLGGLPSPTPTPKPGTGTPTRAPTGPTSRPTTPGQPAPPASTVIDGDSASTEFGYVTVGITVVNGKITDVVNEELPGNEPRSISISAKAGPTLRQRALTAQSSKIDSVSGATYTSNAYKQSLQSAIDKAGLA